MPSSHLLVGLGDTGDKHVEFALIREAALHQAVHGDLVTEQKKCIAWREKENQISLL